MHMTTGLVCLPSVHLIGGWHMFAKEALSFLHQIKQACYNRQHGAVGRVVGPGAALAVVTGLLPP